MSDKLGLTKALSSESIRKSEWWPVWDGPKKSAVFCCPVCGNLGSLTASADVEGIGWTILPNGDVTPSVDHAPAGCSFHRNIRLDGWTA